MSEWGVLIGVALFNATACAVLLGLGRRGHRQRMAAERIEFRAHAERMRDLDRQFWALRAR